MNIKNIILIVAIACLMLVTIIWGFVLNQDKYITYTDGQSVNEYWSIKIMPSQEDLASTARKRVVLINRSSNVEYVIYDYLLYISDNDLYGKVYNVGNEEYFVTRIDNEGSLDTLYYSVFKLSDNTVEKMTDTNYIWACSDPILSKKELRFYGDTFSEESDCFFLLSNNFLFKKYLGSVELK